MSHPEDAEESTPLLKKDAEDTTSHTKAFFVALKWVCAVFVLVGRLVGLSMFIVWASDCFLREFHTTALCTAFFLFPSPKIFLSAWLFLCTITSSVLIFYVRRLNHFYGNAVLQHLIRKKYFWKLVVTLISVCIYDLLILVNKSETFKTLSYVLFMCEKSSAVVVALFLNFLPSDTSGPSQKDSAMKLGLYKAALFVYALEGYTMAILGSTIAVYKVLTVPNTADTNAAPDIQAVVSLMLLITNNALRYYLAEFFFSKLFDQDVDILGGGTKNISESLARPATVHQAQESKEESCQMPAPF
ncbi:uncharacterized protein [Montipora foliosa]|uniref:uncharacterized protein n=1 Tax=Montipora foliosa TaxID=591990 RepID=UPI0035F1F833